MRFWDSSALVPLVVEEARSRACRELRRSDPAVVVWTLSRTEVVSTVRRLERRRQLSQDEARAALVRFDAMFLRFSEVVMLEAVRDRAERALGMHDLTAADALQLGAALVLVGDRPKRRGFVTADARLGAAASSEGFDVVIPKEK